jgi:hypothetical protein
LSIKTCPNFERTPKLLAYYGMLKPLTIMSGKAPGKPIRVKLGKALP